MPSDIGNKIIDTVSRWLHPACRFLPQRRVRILRYQRVYAPSAKCAGGVNALCVHPYEFERQMNWLAMHRYNVITMADLYNIMTGDRKIPHQCVIITFDDGYKDNFLNAVPILKKYKLRATFFLTTDYIGADTPFSWLNLNNGLKEEYESRKQFWLPMNVEEIRMMVKLGHCFGSRTRRNIPLNEATESKPDAVKKYLMESMWHLEKITGDDVSCFCYPRDSFTDPVRNQVVLAGYDIAVGPDGGSNGIDDDYFSLKRIPIQETDSLQTFIRKVDGAFDWWYGLVRPRVTRFEELWREYRDKSKK